MTTKEAKGIQKALLVFVLDPTLREVVEATDQQALKQACEALAGGLHPKVITGLCPVCDRFGDDCTGSVALAADGGLD